MENEFDIETGDPLITTSNYNRRSDGKRPLMPFVDYNPRTNKKYEEIPQKLPASTPITRKKERDDIANDGGGEVAFDDSLQRDLYWSYWRANNKQQEVWDDDDDLDFSKFQSQLKVNKELRRQLYEASVPYTDKWDVSYNKFLEDIGQKPDNLVGVFNKTYDTVFKEENRKYKELEKAQRAEYAKFGINPDLVIEQDATRVPRHIDKKAEKTLKINNVNQSKSPDVWYDKRDTYDLRPVARAKTEEYFLEDIKSGEISVDDFTLETFYDIEYGEGKWEDGFKMADELDDKAVRDLNTKMFSNIKSNGKGQIKTNVGDVDIDKYLSPQWGEWYMREYPSAANEYLSQVSYLQSGEINRHRMHSEALGLKMSFLSRMAERSKGLVEDEIGSENIDLYHNFLSDNDKIKGITGGNISLNPNITQSQVENILPSISEDNQKILFNIIGKYDVNDYQKVLEIDNKINASRNMGALSELSKELNTTSGYISSLPVMYKEVAALSALKDKAQFNYDKSYKDASTAMRAIYRAKEILEGFGDKVANMSTSMTALGSLLLREDELGLSQRSNRVNAFVNSYATRPIHSKTAPYTLKNGDVVEMSFDDNGRINGIYDKDGFIYSEDISDEDLHSIRSKSSSIYENATHTFNGSSLFHTVSTVVGDIVVTGLLTRGIGASGLKGMPLMTSTMVTQYTGANAVGDMQDGHLDPDSAAFTGLMKSMGEVVLSSVGEKLTGAAKGIESRMYDKDAPMNMFGAKENRIAGIKHLMKLYKDGITNPAYRETFMKTFKGYSLEFLKDLGGENFEELSANYLGDIINSFANDYLGGHFELGVEAQDNIETVLVTTLSTIPFSLRNHKDYFKENSKGFANELMIHVANSPSNVVLLQNQLDDMVQNRMLSRVEADRFFRLVMSKKTR